MSSSVARRCASNWAFQEVVSVQLPGLFTLAVQCSEPSGLQEMVTPEIDGHTLHGPGVSVRVGVRAGVDVMVIVSAGVGVCVLAVVGVFEGV